MSATPDSPLNYEHGQSEHSLGTFPSLFVLLQRHRGMAQDRNVETIQVESV